MTKSERRKKLRFMKRQTARIKLMDKLLSYETSGELHACLTASGDVREVL
jgi:hypothetical protein